MSDSSGSPTQSKILEEFCAMHHTQESIGEATNFVNFVAEGAGIEPAPESTGPV